jgi:hypothetical protein
MNLVLHPRKTVLVDGFLLCLRHLFDLQGTVDYFGGSPGTARLMQHFQNWTEKTNKFWSLCLSHLFLLSPNVRRQPLESAGCSPGLEDIFREPLGTLYQFHDPLLRRLCILLVFTEIAQISQEADFLPRWRIDDGCSLEGVIKISDRGVLLRTLYTMCQRDLLKMTLNQDADKCVCCTGSGNLTQGFHPAQNRILTL